MKSEFFRHKIAYLILLVMLGVYVLLFFGFWPNRIYQRYLTFFIAVFYFLWGVVSHSRSNTISKRVILEYLGVAVLGGLMLFLVTL